MRTSSGWLPGAGRDAMPDGGIVEVSTTTVKLSGQKGGVQVAIRDTGKGIRANAAERVFEPYYQSRTGNRNPGFSLALVYQFVALSGGSIEVESAPEKGAGYLLNFPASRENFRNLPVGHSMPGPRTAATACTAGTHDPRPVAIGLRLALFDALANNTSDMIVVAGLDGVARYVSPACRPLTGYDSEELLGPLRPELIHRA